MDTSWSGKYLEGVIFICCCLDVAIARQFLHQWRSIAQRFGFERFSQPSQATLLEMELWHRCDVPRRLTFVSYQRGRETICREE